MAPTLLGPQGHLSSAEALQLAQQAPAILRTNPRAISASPLQFLFSSTETAELWMIYENLLLTCLRTGDDDSAHRVLERLVLRFGDEDERVVALKGLVKEATATSDRDLDQVLSEYEVLLEENGANIHVAKRRVALLRSLDRVPDAISALVSLLEFNPTDAESWAELADMYVSQGLYSQAIHALEEVLIMTPNAWNIHARLGEVSLISANVSAEGSGQKHLADSLKRFCRSIELCKNYLRGYYGLKLVTDRLVEPARTKKQAEAEGSALPSREVIQKLNQAATEKLAEIVRRYGAPDPLWQGYDAGEIAAARELLDKSSAAVVR